MSGCYVSGGRPVQVSQPPQPQNRFPPAHPQPQRPCNLATQPSAYAPALVSVPNVLAQHHFNKEQTNATVPNPPKPAQITSFSPRSLMPYYPLSKGKIIYSVSFYIFSLC